MKKILYIFALIASFSANAQDINPTIGTELCPNQEYTFTVSGLPGAYNTINTSGGATITQYPSGSGTSITFKGKFSDVTGAGQVFTITWANGGTKDFKFTKVKSLFGGYSENFNNPTTLTVPICQTTPVSLNISGNKYWDVSTSPYSSFGSITTYRYLLPSGWYLNSTLSNGSNWITATGGVTITPTANTGNGATIQYVAKNDCSGAFFEGTPRYISISRPNPTFTLSPTSLTFVCGTPQTRTFTVSTTSSNSCSTSYNWNLGTNNGWLYNGSPAPASFSTTTSSITLTSASGNVLPSSVNVTPILNGISYSQMSCSTSFSSFTSTASVNGNTVICPGGNSVYTISGLGAGNTVIWSSSNTAVATVSGGTQSQVTVNGISQGLVNLIATITNPCGQTVTKTKTINVGAPVMPNGTIYGELWVRKNFFPQTLTFPTVLGATSYTWTITPGGDFPPNCPATGSVPAKFNNNLQTITTTTPSATASFGNCLGDYEVTCTISNACGSTVAYVRYVTVGNSGTSPCFVDYSISKTFTISQNPIKNGDIKIRKINTIQIEDIDLGDDIPDSKIVDGDSPCYQEWPKVYNGLKINPNVKNAKPNPQVEVKVFDFFGKQVYAKTINVSKEEISIKDSNLTSGKYILHINDGITTQKEIIIVE